MYMCMQRVNFRSFEIIYQRAPPPIGLTGEFSPEAVPHSGFRSSTHEQASIAVKW
ncbi:hypothetical protein SCLCIDRAFT_1209446 [Scleroderma citrinum Foug A]|uniref:Uncharacterized protein n=1 Tax=Scleroderma citrinum Foug A TaxID=1036808 RepID=A0A0C3E5J4_9AGAM|nr:hypothetical protein SCLCIDRAFT_1209446 [Scleroderma citrinum Foug A]